MASKRDFHLGDILSITTGRLVSPRHMGGVHDLLDFMTGDNLFTHQLPRAAEECGPALLRQHPDLANLPVPEFADPAEVDPWVVGQVVRFGEYRSVEPLAPGVHVVIDPLVELRLMAPETPIVGVVVDGTEPAVAAVDGSGA